MRLLSYAGYRFPPDIIQHAIWLYLRFTLSVRDVEELLAERCIDVSPETIRRWVAVFGPMIARRLRAMRPKPHATWHLDEMFVAIGGKRMYLWRAVDAEGEVLDCLVQSRRNKRGALRLVRKLIRKYRMIPSKFVTDGVSSYAAARAELTVTIVHERGLRQNNRAESLHVPVRRRERKMQHFRSPDRLRGSAQRTLRSTTISTSVDTSSRLQRSVGSVPRRLRHGAPRWALLPEAAFICNQLDRTRQRDKPQLTADSPLIHFIHSNDEMCMNIS
jgi:putative transposase